MRLKYICLLLLLITLTSAQAQKASSDLITKAIYERLVRAFGEARQAPHLEILAASSSKRIIAAYTPNPIPTIKVDEFLIDLCRSFGADSANALAIVLSHELAHYYRQHEFCSEFAFAMRGTNLSQHLKLASKDQKLINESQADNDGLFISYLAGFKSNGLHEHLLDEIYKKYSLPDQVTGYPSRLERKLIARKAETEINSLYPVFLSANFLLLTGDYQTAGKCFNYLLQKFPSRELLNNAGVCQLSYALSKTDKYEMPFLLPVEIDGLSRLQTSVTRSGLSQDDLVVKEALVKARRYFEEAIRKDPDYVTAYINLACCHIVEGNMEAAIGRLNDLLNHPDAPPSAYMARAIALHLNQQPTKALRDLQKAREKSKADQYNKELIVSNNALRDDKADLADWMVEYWQKYPASNSKKLIKPLSARLFDDLGSEMNKPLAIGNSVNVESKQKNGTWQVRVTNNQTSREFVYTLLPDNSPYKNTETILEEFGEPEQHDNTATSTFWNYPNVIFWISEGHPKARYSYAKP